MGSRVVVRGVDGSGSHCATAVLEHGQDPRRLLAAAGWGVLNLVAITHNGAAKDIELDFRVRRLRTAHTVDAAPALEVSASEARGAQRRQRVAAYAVVTSARGLLLTQFSAQVSHPGAWGLPGGGVEPAENPDDAVLREVWEESGQHVRLDAALDVLTQHWVGRAPNGEVEDFHAVRLVYRAHCDHPTDPVVHDVGGTTESAAWVPLEQLDQHDVIPWARALLAATGD